MSGEDFESLRLRIEALESEVARLKEIEQRRNAPTSVYESIATQEDEFRSKLYETNPDLIPRKTPSVSGVSPSVSKPVSNPSFRVQKVSNKPFESSQALGFLGVLVIVFSVAAGVGIAIQQGLLTPPLQLLFLVGLGFGLLGGALRYRKIDGPHFGLLGGGGLSVLFIASYASYSVLRVLDQEPALVSAMVVGVIGLFAARKFQHRAFALLAVIGTHLGPIVLGLTHPMVLASYYFIWSVVFAYEASRHKAIEVLWASSLLSLSLTSIPSESIKDKEWLWLAVFFVPQLLIYTWTYVSTKWDNYKLEPWHGSLAQLVMAILFYLQLRIYIPNVAYTQVIQLFITVYVAYLVFQKPEKLPNGFGLRYFLSGFFLIVFVMEYYLKYPKARDFFILPVLGGAFYLSQLKEWRDIGRILVISVGMLFSALVLEMLSQYKGTGTAHAAIVLILYTALAYYFVAHLYSKKLPIAQNALYFAHVIAMRAIVEISPNRIVVSLVWSLLAIATLGVAKRLENRWIGKSSLVIFGFSGLKLIFYDLDDANSLYQVISGVFFGLTMWFGGLVLKSIQADPPAAEDKPEVHP